MNTSQKVVFLSKTENEWHNILTQLKYEFPEITFLTLDDDQRSELIKDANAIVCGKLTEDEIGSAEKLKVIFVPFTGLNNFPLEKIKRNKIIISNTHANAPYVAEHAVALALSLLGNIIPNHYGLSKGKWSRDKENSLWISLRNKPVGILGFGNIGENIAKLLLPFGCRIYGFKKNPGGVYPTGCEVSADINYVVENSGIIFVCLPLNPETKHIINADILFKMKGKYLINVGRGETISEEALYNALKNGILKGAALDVWFNYPKNKPEPVYPGNFPFWELPNVLLSPHKSSQTEDSIEAMIKDTYENIRSYLVNGIPKQIVKL